ncbi:MAG: hypothetical protein R3Y28_07730 [Candidatus Gastranaerophilales bacterium]
MQIHNMRTNQNPNFKALQFPKGTNMLTVAGELAEAGYKSMNTQGLSYRATIDTLIEKNRHFGFFPSSEKITGKTTKLEMDVFNKLAEKFPDVKIVKNN